MDSNISIRAAANEDFEGLLPLMHEFLDHQQVLTPEDMIDKEHADRIILKYLNGDPGKYFTLVAVADNGEIAGCCMSSLEETEEILKDDIFGEIKYLFTAEQHRSKGIGQELIEAATIEFQRRGLKLMSLDVLVNNEGAVAFYRRAGFVPVTCSMYREI
ncbi:MAG: GNAT family N-acetyltransferase [Lentisphaerae bacterium]|nr:GNAT family N-acetyltransferase [Lentisphaerota bacterium]MCP4099819.1 GNAT family N-acetyltransferase [Lentisphaerota bacterium]